jgi:uncharacterized protein (TIGR03086 family)
MGTHTFADTQQLLATAVDGFRQRLDGVVDADWKRPTPCDGWNVADLTKHLVGGGIMSELLLRGASKDEAVHALFSLDVQGDIVEAFDDSCRRQAAAFEQPGAADAVCHHPAHDMPGSEFIWRRVRDTLIHTWDLARALGTDEQLEPDLVALTWAQVQPAAPALAGSGMFGSGASGALADDAPVQDRLLDALGRRP